MKRIIAIFIALLIFSSGIAYAQPSKPSSSYSEKPVRWQKLSGFYDIGHAEDVEITARTLTNTEASIVSADADEDGEYDDLYIDSVRLHIVISNTETGYDYIVFLTDTEGLLNANTEIRYVLQKTASEQTVSFDVFPSDLKDDMTLYLSITSNSDSFSSVCIPVSYCQDKDCWLKPTDDTVLKGDVNNDGSIDASDLTALARHIAKIYEITDDSCLDAADVTYDSAVSATDLTKLARYVARIINDL